MPARIEHLVHALPTVNGFNVQGMTQHEGSLAHSAALKLHSGIAEKILSLLKKASESGDAPKPQVGFLTDRIRFNEGRSPADYALYEKQGRGWAENAGWR